MLVNSNCAIKEIVHRLSKQRVSKTNWKNVELDLMRCTNILQAICYLMDGETNNWFNKSNVGDEFRSIITDQHLQPLLMEWYITEDLHPENVSEEGKSCINATFVANRYTIIWCF